MSKEVPERIRWKYSDNATKKRHCAECNKRLTKDEVLLCASCLDEMLNEDKESDCFEENGEEHHEL